MTKLLICILLSLALASCGVRGDPEAPKFTQSQ
jgi:Prokaryotic lipoprotein-attachment site